MLQNFKILGKDVSAADVKSFIEPYRKEFQKNKVKYKELLQEMGLQHVMSRFKRNASILSKMHGRYDDKYLSDLKDVIGFRAIVDNIAEENKALDNIENIFNVFEIHRNIEFPRRNGYRGINLFVKTKSGLVFEIQIKTWNQQVFDWFTHDVIYKEHKLEKDKNVNIYLNELSLYLYKLDRGNRNLDLPTPIEPPIMQKYKMKFDWNEIRGR